MIKSKLPTKLVLLLLVSVFMGCATKGETYKFYDGEARPATELATIVPFQEINLLPARRTDIFITAIDGKLTETYNLEIPSYKILPGEHRIRVGFYLLAGGKEARGVIPEEMVFTAEAAHTYITKANLPESIAPGQALISFWIEDVETREVMVGTRPVQAE